MNKLYVKQKIVQIYNSETEVMDDKTIYKVKKVVNSISPKIDHELTIVELDYYCHEANWIVIID